MCLSYIFHWPKLNWSWTALFKACCSNQKKIDVPHEDENAPPILTHIEFLKQEKARMNEDSNTNGGDA